MSENVDVKYDVSTFFLRAQDKNDYEKVVRDWRLVVAKFDFTPTKLG